jgi:hypothetical protein
VSFKNFISSLTKQNIEDKMRKVPALYYNVAIKLEILENELLVKKNNLEQLESKYFRNISLTYRNVKTITPTRISHEINCKADIKKLKEEIIAIRKAIGFGKRKLETLNLMSTIIKNTGYSYRVEKKL